MCSVLIRNSTSILSVYITLCISICLCNSLHIIYLGITIHVLCTHNGIIGDIHRPKIPVLIKNRLIIIPVRDNRYYIKYHQIVIGNHHMFIVLRSSFLFCINVYVYE